MWLALGLLAAFVPCAEGRNYHGVRPGDRVKYPVSGTFTCLDGSQSIDSDQINDNFCDCADGSDEPGTSACPQGSFYCLNVGHEGKAVPSSRVNDGICDCCDGSDEWRDQERCENTCRADALEAFRGQIARIDIIKSGYAKREALVAKAASLRGEKEAERERAQREKQQAETRLAEAKAKRDALEPSDDESAAAADGDKEVTVEATNEGEVRIATDDQKEEEKSFPYPKEYAAPDAASGGDDEESEKFPYPKEYAAPDAASGGDDEESEKFPYPKEYAAPPADDGAASDGDDQDVDSDEDESGSDDAAESDGDSASNDGADETPKEDPELVAARDAVSEAERDVERLSNSLGDLEKYLDGEFGADNVFLAVYKECVSLKVKQYDYEVCFFDKASQKEGGSTTRLGSFKKYNTEDQTMEFTGGQTCWNGPARSLKAKFSCGEETKLLKIDEPNKCVYEADIETPLVCDIKEAEKLQAIVDAAQN